MNASLVTGAVTGLVGLGLITLGWAFVEAGKGGYGVSPLPMLKVSRDHGLLAIGFLNLLIGLGLLFAATAVIR